METTTLWQFENWRTDRDIVFNTDIVEYDLKSAGLSVAKEFNLLPEKYIKELEAMPKKDRVVSLGLYKRDHPEYSAGEKVGLEAARQMFMENNSLNPTDIIAIKKDAIFVEESLKKVLYTKFGNHLEFRAKNTYRGYMYIKPLEIFYNPKSGLDVKGMSQEVYENHHKDYFGRFIEAIFKLLETDPNNKGLIYRHIRQFYDEYRLKELDIEYYREFNALSQYKAAPNSTGFDSIWRDVKDLDISFNAGVITSILMCVLSI